MKGFIKSLGGGGNKAPTGEAVKADIAIPKGRDKRRPSFAKQPKIQLKELPLLSETPMLKRETLFRQKLKLCCNMFDFDETDPDTKGMDIKRETLLEIAEYVNTAVGQKIFTESI